MERAILVLRELLDDYESTTGDSFDNESDYMWHQGKIEGIAEALEELRKVDGNA